MKKKKSSKQQYHWKDRTLKYRITSGGLRRLEREIGERTEQVINGHQGLEKVLWYITEWKGIMPSLDVFLSGCGRGYLRIEIRRGEKRRSEIRRKILLSTAEFRRKRLLI